MKNIIRRAAPWNKWVPLLFFGAFLALGLALYDDYGISWDENLQREHGLVSAQYVHQQLGYTDHPYSWQTLDDYQHRYYGVWFSLPAAWLEKGLGLTGFRQQFRMRHLMVFLIFWAASIFLYRVLRDRFGHWGWALLGMVFFLASPRIFAHAFFNPKDIPLLSLYIVGLYTLLKMWLKPGLGNALLHGLVCGMLISMRVSGIILPVLSIFLVLADLLFHQNRRAAFQKPLLAILVLIPATAAFTTLFWPFLWASPWANFIEAFQEMGKYGWQGKVLFRGEHLAAGELSAYYLPWMMGITIPLLYLLLAGGAVLGMLAAVVRQLRARWGLWGDDNERKDWAMLGALLAPLAAVILLNATVYDGWRHLYFIYPCLIYLAVLGLYQLWQRTEGLLRIRQLLIVLTSLSLLYTAWFMVRFHPNQQVYFNELAGGDQLGRYDLDYWGLSYRQGMERLLKIDSRNKIRLAYHSYPAELNWQYLKPALRSRIELVGKNDKPDYFISTYRHWEDGFRLLRQRRGIYTGEKVYDIRVGESEILGIYRMEN